MALKVVMTSTNTTLTKAENRRRWHREQIEAAGHLRARIWKAAGWLASEISRRPPVEQTEAVTRLVEMAAELNERNGGDDYT